MIGVIVIIAVFLAGLVLVIVGLRGRRVNDHPHCATCGFDLTGLYPDAEKCPECGEPIDNEWNIRFGLKAKRKKPLITGMIMLVISLLIGGNAIWFITQGSSVNQYLPTWVLVWETSWLDNTTTASALTELQTRIANKQLSQSTIDNLVSHGLAVQGDLQKTWLPEWGDCIETAHAAGNVSEEDINLYCRQIAILDFVMRKYVRSRDKVPISWQFKETRAGTKPSYSWRSNLLSIKQGDELVTLSTPGGGFGGIGMVTGNTGSSISAWRVLNLQADANTKLEATVEYSILLGIGQNLPIVWQEIHETGSVVIPSDGEDVKEIVDESLRDVLMNSLSVDEVTISNTTRDPEVQSFQAILVFENFPANVAFEVFIRVDREEFMRIDGEEFLMGTASATKRGNNVHRKFLNSNINLNLSSKIELVDVIMRSSKDVARSTLDIYEFWGGELVFEDVKVIDNRN